MSGKEQDWKTEDELKEGFRRMRLQSIRSAKRHGNCPDEALLAAYADGLLKESERGKAEEHFADCDACLEQIGFLVQLSRQSRDLRPVADELVAKAQSLAARPARRWPVRYLVPAAAAALLLLAIAPWVGFQETAPPQPERLLRNSQEAAELQVVTPQAETGLSLPFDIEWKPLPQAASYRILVVTSEGEPVWQGQTTRARISLPADLQLSPGEKYFFQVRTQIPGGKEANSPYIAFTVRKAL